MEYLLDTNICIYIIKKKPIQVFEKLISLNPGQVGISSITLAELQYGVAKSTNSKSNSEALEKFLVPLEILEFDSLAAVEYGRIRTNLEKNGTPIGPMDLLIAANAIAENLVLVTNNEREFERVEGLKIENWTN
ncbi:MAG: type II toxin-antitoxin system VapC family toxin [Cytophagaceae bacterium]|nr:type II toxin-antitoxin system VapC family toxin [Cytophagaceae bacterium]MBK9935104.1 type II toxin-antitoxin system VapC family toxin [Cytophagaceae bacterium]MBL0301546.1 type II toxin-antitoxin system VapC family toxin [Cytophagaceae bacterium]MBL0324369.1 type II toxin-antitoxin system VapC family toxin [Cytophagaceae bacterium]